MTREVRQMKVKQTKSIKTEVVTVKEPSPKYATRKKEEKNQKIMVSDVSLDYAPNATGENKSQRLELRLTKIQKEIISKASQVSGFKNVSDYLLYIAITDSKNVMREQQIFELSQKDRVSFIKALQHPPKPNKSLKKALENYLSFNEGN